MLLRSTEENTSYSHHRKLQWANHQFIINLYAIMADASDLGFFTLLARQPSLAAAAQALGVTPPAVSRRLAALEKRLGVRLLNRTTRRLSLTEAGRDFHERSVQLLADLEEAEQAAGGVGATPRGTLKLTAPITYGVRVLAPAIAAFVAQRYSEDALRKLYLGVAGAADDAAAAAAIRDAVGVPQPELERQWRAWVRKQTGG